MFCENSGQLLAVDYFRKALHLKCFSRVLEYFAYVLMDKDDPKSENFRFVDNSEKWSKISFSRTLRNNSLLPILGGNGLKRNFSTCCHLYLCLSIYLSLTIYISKALSIYLKHRLLNIEENTFCLLCHILAS